ncbi:MAG: phosphopyruvate hydratase [Candidatus Pacebacteria bacterium]|nr:phosphopyruvate hydratase [Candidatus Paceibacterota bacterium]
MASKPVKKTVSVKAPIKASVKPVARPSAKSSKPVTSAKKAVAPAIPKNALPKIKAIVGREILDSRGNPTVEVDVTLADGSFGRAAVPSGASTGSYEAIELRDGDKKRYGGKGVLKAVANANGPLRKALVGKQFNQETLDARMIELDGTHNKAVLGANAILGISLAFAHAAAKSQKKPLYKYFADIAKTGKPMSLPLPMMNILNGGKHAEKSTDLQEFMVMPVGAKSWAQALQMGAEVFHALKKILHDKGLGTTTGDEGGYAPSLGNNENALKVILEAIEKAGYAPGKDIAIAIDAASTELYKAGADSVTADVANGVVGETKNGTYELTSENRTLSTPEMVAFYEEWLTKYPIVSIEDGFSEDDWAGYEQLTKSSGKKVQIVGDDLFVTNIDRLKTGIERKAGNSILIKLNQIGSVTETIAAIKMANAAKMTCVISHRSGETEDTTIAHFVVGLGCGQIKTGSLCRTDRVAKYNELLRIEEQLGKKAVFAGRGAFKA